MNREIQIHPGRDDRPSGQGFKCAELLFILKDLHAPGAATLAIRTNWLPANMEHGVIRPITSLQTIDLIFHFPTPTLTVQQDKRELCPYLNTTCHSINDRKAGPILIAMLQAEGSEAVWQFLEKLYIQEARINRAINTGGSIDGIRPR